MFTRRTKPFRIIGDPYNQRRVSGVLLLVYTYIYIYIYIYIKLQFLPHRKHILCNLQRQFGKCCCTKQTFLHPVPQETTKLGIFSVTAVGIYNYHWDFKGYIYSTYRLNDLGFESRQERCFSAPNCPERLWVSTNRPFKGHPAFLPRVKRRGRETDH